jgi:sigma-B regulation protein RsbU (phosphoserine phosphatase)
VRSRTGECLLLNEAGPIVGILPDAQFTNTVVPLEPGDFLTMFTDGVTEQEDEQGEEFSTDRLRQVVLREQGESASAAVAHIAEAVSAYAGAREQADDLTVVVMKVL